MRKLWPPKVEKYSSDGLQINELLSKNGFSRHQLATYFGISPSYMTDILQGNRPTSKYIPAMLYWLENTDESPDAVKHKYGIGK